MNAVELQNVTKSFGSTVAVNDLSLAVPQGSIYGFIGPNGSGKTTTLRMIMSIYFPDKGAIQVFGQPMGGPCTDRIGYLPEERGLYRRMKVREIIKFYGELKGGKEVNQQTEYWINKLQLKEWANKKVDALSKGMAQRVQFIATVVAKPELLILDEPFTGLDPVNAEQIQTAILELRAQGATVILSTHDMNVAEQMCDFIFMIFEGRKVLDGTLGTIQDRYGADTIRVRTADGAAVLQNLEGIQSIKDSGQIQELQMMRECDPQKILAALMQRTRILSFEVTKPSLHDIFIRIAGPGAKEVNHE